MRARSRHRSLRRNINKFFVYVQILLLLLLAIALGVIGGTFYSVSRLLPAKVDIANYRPAEATKIFSSDGVILGSVAQENREVVSIGYPEGSSESHRSDRG